MLFQGESDEEAVSADVVTKILESHKRIPAGLVHINDQTIGDDPFAPFGGVGASGNGARHGGPAN